MEKFVFSLQPTLDLTNINKELQKIASLTIKNITLQESAISDFKKKLQNALKDVSITVTLNPESLTSINKKVKSAVGVETTEKTTRKKTPSKTNDATARAWKNQGKAIAEASRKVTAFKRDVLKATQTDVDVSGFEDKIKSFEKLYETMGKALNATDYAKAKQNFETYNAELIAGLEKQKLKRDELTGGLSDRDILKQKSYEEKIFKSGLTEIDAAGLAITKLNGKIQESAQSGYTFAEGYKEKLLDLKHAQDKMSAAFASGDKRGFAKAKEEFDLLSKGTKFNFETELLEAKQASNELLKTTGYEFKKYIARALSSQLIQNITTAIKSAIQYIKELDTALSQVQMVTGMSSQSVKKLAVEYTKLGKEMGVATTEVANAALEYFRQGKSTNETLSLTRQSIKLAKLSAIDFASATTYLTAAMNSYRLSADEVGEVVDKLITLDNSYATSAAELSEALSKTAVSAKTAGVSMDKILAYITTISQTTRMGAEEVGTGLRQMFARMGTIKLGALDDAGAGLNDVERSLRLVGISLRNTEGDFRNMETVLDEVARSWGNYSTIEQNAIAVALGGTRQREKMLTLLENYDIVLEAQKKSAASAGTAEERYGFYISSVAGKQEKLKASTQELVKTMIGGDSSFYKGLVDLANVAVKFANAMGGWGIILPPLIVWFGQLAKKTEVFNDLFNFKKNKRDLDTVTSNIENIGFQIDKINNKKRKSKQDIEDLNSLQNSLNNNLSEQNALEKKNLSLKSLGKNLLKQAGAAIAIAAVSWAVSKVVNAFQSWNNQYSVLLDKITEFESKLEEIKTRETEILEREKELNKIQDKTVAQISEKSRNQAELNALKAEELRLENEIARNQVKAGQASLVSISKNNPNTVAVMEEGGIHYETAKEYAGVSFGFHDKQLGKTKTFSVSEMESLFGTMTAEGINYEDYTAAAKAYDEKMADLKIALAAYNTYVEGVRASVIDFYRTQGKEATEEEIAQEVKNKIIRDKSGEFGVQQGTDWLAQAEALKQFYEGQNAAITSALGEGESEASPLWDSVKLARDKIDKYAAYYKEIAETGILSEEKLNELLEATDEEHYLQELRDMLQQNADDTWTISIENIQDAAQAAGDGIVSLATKWQQELTDKERILKNELKVVTEQARLTYNSEKQVWEATEGSAIAAKDLNGGLKGALASANSLQGSLTGVATNLQYATNVIKAYENVVLEAAEDALEKAKEELEAIKELHSRVLEAITQYYDEEINKLQTQLDLDKERTDESEKQKELEQDKLDIAEKERKLEELRAAKTIRVYRQGKGWEYISDAAAIKEAEEDLTEAKTNLSKRLQEEEYDKRQKIIDTLEEEKEAMLKLITDVEDFSDAWKALNVTMEDFAKLTEAEKRAKLQYYYNGTNGQGATTLSPDVYNYKNKLTAAQEKVDVNESKVKALIKSNTDAQTNAAIADYEATKLQAKTNLDVAASGNAQAQSNLTTATAAVGNARDAFTESTFASIEKNDAMSEYNFKDSLSAYKSAKAKQQAAANKAAAAAKALGDAEASAKIFGYASGGVVNYAGISMLHGSPLNQEVVLNGAQSANLLYKLANQEGLKNGQSTDNSIVVNQLTVNAPNGATFDSILKTARTKLRSF